MERMGFGYDALRQENPRLIYCSISGFGRTGPYTDRGGFDLVAQGMSGLMSITGEGPGRPPVKVGSPVTDITAGMLAGMGILAALVHRAQTGEGQMVDTSLLEAGVVQTYWQSAMALANDVAPQPMGSAHPLNAPYQAFETRDGWITVGAANQANWQRLLDVLGAEELGADPRFATNADRMHNLKALEQALTTHFRTRPSGEWLKRLDAAGVPAGPVLDVPQMLQNEQVQARQMVVETEHARVGRVKSLGSPVKFSRTPTNVRRPAPIYGQHTREVLREHGFTEDEIVRLIAEGAAVAAD
jgi:crotonobetainyl-CoA:carnitine CoA-transferase CaiB-like acyl-CoA transferase